METDKIIAEKNSEIERLHAYCNELRGIQHGIMTRLQALELSVVKLVMQTMDKENEHKYNDEYINELKETLEAIHGLNKEYSDKSSIKLKRYLSPQKTRNKMLDNLIGYFFTQCIGKNIGFRVNIIGNIQTMIKKTVSNEDLQMLLSNHVKNAIEAVEPNYNPFSEILVRLGLTADNCYMFSVLDNGSPFEVNTLVRLGLERVTTRAAVGGSGFGFMSTFEIIRKCNASLYIHERMPGGGGFTKAVTVRFDGMNQYIIETYRPDKFPQSAYYIIQSTA